MSNILIATVGASPAVVTETLWALMNPQAHGGRERFVPDMVHILTTEHGRNLVDHFALEERIRTLYDQHEEQPPALVCEVPVLADGTMINDIRTQEENIAYADQLTRIVRDYTADEGNVVHMSIAGGRKTMTSYGHTAMIFFGRPRDALSHVLVEPPVLETCPDFWWPGQPEAIVYDRLKNPVSTSVNAVKVDLVETPFPRLRYLLPEEELFPGGEISYARIVQQVQEALELTKLELVIGERLVRAGGVEFRLPHAQFAFYALLAWAARERYSGAGAGCAGAGHAGWLTMNRILDPRDRRAAEKLLEFYDLAHKRGVDRADDLRELMQRFWETQDGALMEELKRRLSEIKSKLGKSLRSRIENPYVLDRVQIKHARLGGQHCFGLLLRPSQISIVEEMEERQP